MRLKRLFLPVAALTLVSCGAKPTADSVLETTIGTTTTVASTTTAQPPDTVDSLQRTRAVNRFLDAAREEINCQAQDSGFDCATSDATYKRLDRARIAANGIPGTDVREMVISIGAAWSDWLKCLSAAAERGGSRFDCTTQEIAIKQKITDLYDSLR